MKYIAGVDVGNNSTEVAIAKVSLEGDIDFLASAMVKTTGIKGTLRNVQGIIDALDIAIEPLEIQRKDISLVLLNKATPVIGDVAMETITETVITESAMIGHNPSTPAGMGLGLGTTISLEDLKSASPDKRWIVVIDGSIEFREAAARLNEATSMNYRLKVQ
jgi:diol dehydratase reactivase alpha subunit